MKKLITLILISLMCLAFGTNSLAATVYLDVITNGDVDYLEEEDLSGQIIGIDYSTKTFKVGLEHLNGSVDVGPFEIDLTQTELKGGYGITDNLYVTLSVVGGDLEDEASYDSLMIGVDLATNLTKELLLEGSISGSISGSVDYDYYDKLDADFLCFKGKLTYFFTNNLGASLGYRKTKIEDEEDIKIETSGTTIGISYKF